MKHINQILIVILITIFFGSCTKNEISEICIDYVCIDGEWNWVQSYGSIAGTIITQETEMLKRKLIVDETYYREFVNGDLILETTYEYLKTDELKTFTNDSLVLKLCTGNWYAIFEQENNLIIMEPCADCWDHTYSESDTFFL